MTCVGDPYSGDVTGIQAVRAALGGRNLLLTRSVGGGGKGGRGRSRRRWEEEDKEEEENEWKEGGGGRGECF